MGRIGRGLGVRVSVVFVAHQHTLTRDIQSSNSVRPSRSGIVSKRLNIYSQFLPHGSPIILVL